MNIITGSAGGLGKHVYEHFKENNHKVFGLDVTDSSSTDLVTNLSNKDEINYFVNKVETKIDSITFSHAIGNSKKNIDEFSEDHYRFLNAESNFYIIDRLKDQFNNEASVIFISSVHSQLTNKESSNYAISKLYLEALYRRFCLDDNPSNIRKTLIRLGAMDTAMLRDNVGSLEKLKSALPSKNIIDPKRIADFIYNFHTKYKTDFDCSVLQLDNGVGYQLSTD